MRVYPPRQAAQTSSLVFADFLCIGQGHSPKFNSFASLCEAKLDQINTGVNEIKGKVDHLIDLVQGQHSRDQSSIQLALNHEETIPLAIPSAVPESTPLNDLKQFLEHQILSCLKMYTNMQEREFFIEAALMNISSEKSAHLLKEVLHSAQIEREHDVFLLIKSHMEPSLLSGYFSPNEVENTLFIANKYRKREHHKVGPQEDIHSPRPQEAAPEINTPRGKYRSTSRYQMQHKSKKTKHFQEKVLQDVKVIEWKVHYFCTIIQETLLEQTQA